MIVLRSEVVGRTCEMLSYCFQVSLSHTGTEDEEEVHVSHGGAHPDISATFCMTQV